jgi:small subunit ribosomal protein S4e
MVDFIKFDIGKMAMITRGRNTGRVGTVTVVEKHPGSFDIVTMRDTAGQSFSTRKENVFIIGNADAPAISLPKGSGVKQSILEERDFVMKLRKSKSA